MDKSRKYQIAKLSLIVLLLITPLLSTSMRPPFLYFLLNLLIIGLGAEAGLLSFFKPPEEKRPNTLQVILKAYNEVPEEKEIKIVEKLEPEKIIAVVKALVPSIFFIGEGESEEVEEEEEEEEELGGQELYDKSEMFIGNFYNQLKIQRQDSLKRIHG